MKLGKSLVLAIDSRFPSGKLFGVDRFVLYEQNHLTVNNKETDPYVP
ncbi:hypothetical protein [Vibrio eleionomae]|nr:hypothetical protein [Vibrio eleionomae]